VVELVRGQVRWDGRRQDGSAAPAGVYVVATGRETRPLVLVR
jgi:hypothetical protein